MEALAPGLSSYPHPWLMPDFWQFPTVSMGLGPITAIYQARLMKYLENRGIAKMAGRKVWCFCGDGEMDEPESLGAIDIAAREQLAKLKLGRASCRDTVCQYVSIPVVPRPLTKK